MTPNCSRKEGVCPYVVCLVVFCICLFVWLVFWGVFGFFGVVFFFVFCKSWAREVEGLTTGEMYAVENPMFST